MKKIAIIGSGISGLSIGRLLQKFYDVTIFEADSRPGGMIKCDVIRGNLFHRTGGHVFNTKRNDVFDWFWQHFDKERDFTKALRNSSVAMPSGEYIPYPIENHVYMLGDTIQKSFIQDIVKIVRQDNIEPQNFEEFFQYRFGRTLYDLYFRPYNVKVWHRDLTKVPMSWLEGKLPMPTAEEMIYNNMNHIKERSFVHSSFYYPKKGGSQFIANRFAEGLDIRYNTTIEHVIKQGDVWKIKDEIYDKVIFCGNIKQLPFVLSDTLDICRYYQFINDLEYHGTSSVFCEIDKNDYSWIYLPNHAYDSHRIICTGNFAESNNRDGMMTATVEFTDYISQDDILDNLKRIPYHPRYLTHHYEKYTYPIQNSETRDMINSLKIKLEKKGFYLLGRFAEWEYYNMDVAMGAAIDLSKRLIDKSK